MAARVSVRGDDLSPATLPLVRIVDTVFEHPNAVGTTIAHLRAWTGDAEEGTRTIALIGKLSDGTGIVNFFEDIVDIVVRDHLPFPAEQVAWFDYHPNALGGSRHGVDNVVLSWRRPKWASEPGIQWSRSSIAELESLVGCPVECYPPKAYTAEAVTRWAQTGHPVAVVVDELNIGAELDALTRLDAAYRTGIRPQLSGPACRVSARAVRRRRSMLRDLPWDDGTSTRRNGGQTLTFAAAYVPPQQSDAENELLGRWNAADEPAPQHDALDQLALLRQLFVWQEDVGEDTETPDLATRNAIDRVRRTLRSDIARLDPRLDTTEPVPFIRVLSIQSEVDQTYLRQVDWDDRQCSSPRRRRMRRVLPQGTGQLLFGTDPWLHVVALDDSGAAPHTRFAIEWPTAWSGSPVPDEASVVAGKNPGRGGDLAAYVAVDDQIIGLLPHPPGTPSGWSFGYGGAGPADLTRAIAEFVGHLDGITVPDLARRWLHEQVRNEPSSTLRVSLADFRCRIRRGGGW